MPNIDGLKKLTSDEIKKSRQVILDLINAEDKSISEPVTPKKPIAKKIDSVNFLKKTLAPQPVPKPMVKPDVPKIKSDITPPQKEPPLTLAPDTAPLVTLKAPPKNIIVEKVQRPVKTETPVRSIDFSALREDLEFVKNTARHGSEAISQMENTQKKEENFFREQLKIEQIRKKMEEARQSRQKDLWEKENKLKEKKQKEKEQAEKKRLKSEEDQRQKQIRLLEEKKKREQDELLKKALKEEKKKMRVERKKIFFAKCKDRTKRIIKFLFYLAFVCILILIIFYFAVALLLIKFNIGSGIAVYINRYVPIPVVISKIGMVDYFDYQKIMDEGNIKDSKNIQRALMQNIILKDYATLNGYNILDATHLAEQELFDLNNKILTDKKINEVALSRIGKIKTLLGTGQSFNDVKKFSDDYTLGLYLGKNEISQKYGLSAADLKINKTSEILFAEDGYYILEVFDILDGKYGLNVLFIKGKTLNTYLDEEADKLKVWSFL